MATTTQVRIRGRPAHTAGPTYLSYTPDGTKLVTVGSNNTTRVYKTGFDGEPTNIDDCQEQNMGVAATVRRSCYHFICIKKAIADSHYRMTSSFLVPKMARLAYTPWQQ
jgi:hypothetical protein